MNNKNIKRSKSLKKRRNILRNNVSSKGMDKFAAERMLFPKNRLII